MNARIRRGGGSDAEKAVALCWLLHVIDDIHQPEHAAALFTRELYGPATDAARRPGRQPRQVRRGRGQRQPSLPRTAWPVTAGAGLLTQPSDPRTCHTVVTVIRAWVATMPKNIVVCCDGTNNEVAGDETNVLRLFRMLVRDAGQEI